MESEGIQFCLAALVVLVFGIGMFLLGWIPGRARRKISVKDFLYYSEWKNSFEEL